MPHKNKGHKRIGASQRPSAPASQLPAVGEILDAEVFKITGFGAFVKLPGDRRGLIHISQIAQDYVKNVSDHLKVGDKLKARVVQVSRDGKIDLTLKCDGQQAGAFPKDKVFRSNIFEEKINAFLMQEKQKQPDLETA